MHFPFIKCSTSLTIICKKNYTLALSFYLMILAMDFGQWQKGSFDWQPYYICHLKYLFGASAFGINAFSFFIEACS